MRGISLALGGGGARGFAHVGVLKVLKREGIPIKEIAGTSIGAIIGAYYAFHGSTEELERFAKEMTRKRMLSYLDPTIPKHGLIKGGRFRALLEEWFGDERIERAKTPLTIVATNLRTGETKAFRKGLVVDAIMASVALPGFLPATKIGQDYYVDGGIGAQVPSKFLRKRSTLKISVELPLTGMPKRFSERPTLTSVLNNSYTIARRLAQKKDTADITLKPKVESFQETLSFHKANQYLKAGIDVAEKNIQRIKRKLDKRDD